MTTIKLKNGSGAPTAGDLAQGEPALDLTNKRLYTEDSGGTVIEVGTNPGVDVTFADNRKAIFGAGSDLQLYHSGSHSYILDNGTGDLKIYGANIEIGNASGVKNLFATSGGATTLYHNNLAKIATSSSGIDVTGTAKVSTSMMVGSTDAPSRDLEIKTSNPHIRLTDTDGGYTEIFGGSGITTINADKGQAVAGSVLKLSVDATDGLTIDSSHNVSIPNGDLTLPDNGKAIFGTGSDMSLFHNGNNGFLDNDTGTLFIQTDSFSVKNATGTESLMLGTADGAVTLYHNNLAKLATTSTGIDVTGSVGINTSSPNAPLEVSGAATTSTDIAHFSNSNGVQKVVIGLDGEGDGQITLIDAGNNTDVLLTAGGVSYINTGGNFGIGTSSPSSALHVQGSSGEIRVQDTGSGGGIVSFRDSGTSSIPSIQSSGNDLLVNTGGTEAMRIDSSGNVGINNTSPSTQDASANNLVIEDSAGNGGITIKTPTSAIGSIHFSDGTSGADRYRGMVTYSHSDNSMRFHTDSGERARIDASGNLLVGTTDTFVGDNSTGGGISFASGGAASFARSAGTVMYVNRTGSSAGEAIEFRYSGGDVGNISVTASATAYNTSSDQRLKDNIVDAPSASDDIDAIQVRSFDWKVDGSHQKYGMVAQELQSVAPEAVSEGETEDDMMGVDYSKLVPMLVKEIQSLRARVAQLETN